MDSLRQHPESLDRDQKTLEVPVAPERGRSAPTHDELERAFTYHRPKEDQKERYELLRDAGKGLARIIFRNCPDSREKSTAIAKLREAVMWANASIACNE